MAPVLHIIIAISAVVQAQNTKSCFTYSGTVFQTISGALPSCDYLYNHYEHCDSLPRTAINDCVCNQPLFDSIFDCESEYRECLDNDGADGGLIGVLSDWHKECDGFITFTPTTPSLYSITSTFNPNRAICTNVIQSACGYFTSSVAGCSTQYTLQNQGTQLSSCICATPLISAASVCLYDGNVTCLDLPAALSNIEYYGDCPAQVTSYFNAHPPMTSGQITSSSFFPALPAPKSSGGSGSPTTKSSGVSTSTTYRTTQQPFSSAPSKASSTSSSDAGRNFARSGFLGMGQAMTVPVLLMLAFAMALVL